MLKLASDLKNSQLQKYQIDFLNSFSIPLAVKRSTDISNFLREHNHELSEIKDKQSELFGKCQSNLMLGNLDATVENLNQLAKLEKSQRNLILSLEYS